MSLVSYHIANLSNGVSQQPPALRLPTTCEDTINSWPSVVSGLQKRPPTEHIAQLGFNIADNAAAHIINRAEGYEFIAVVNHNNIQVIDLEGNSQPISYPNGKAYLSSARNPVDDISFLTFGDTTFVLNKKKVVKGHKFGEAGPAASFTPTLTVDSYADIPAAAAVGTTVFVTDTSDYYRRESIAGQANVYGWQEASGWSTAVPASPYRSVDFLPTTVSAGQKVYIKRTTKRTFTERVRDTSGDRWRWENVTRVEEKTEYKKFDAVLVQSSTPGYDGWVKRTLNQLVTTSSTRLNPDAYGTVHVTQSIANSYYSIYINGTLKASFLTKNGTDAANSVEATTVIATQLGAALTASGVANTVYGSTISISGLQASDKLAVQANSGDKSLKCFHQQVQSFTDLPPRDREGRVVRIIGSPSDQGDDYYVVYRDGLWVEEEGWNAGEGFFSSTMPHVLVRNEDGTWTFKPFEWDTRQAGDDESNQSPTFVGRTINDMFVFNNRLVFLSDENIIMSEADNFHNFYRKTVASLLDDDRIDIAVFHKDVNILNHGVPFSNSILLSSDNTQFRLTYDGYLAAKNITITFTTAFNMSTRVKPLNMGSSIYFVDDARSYTFTRIFEYYTKESNNVDEADDVTAHVPEYIPTGVRFMAAHPRMNMMVVNSYSDPTSMYVYKYYWADNKKLQNAWQRWEFPDCIAIHWAGFMDNYMYVLVERRNNVIFLEKIKIDEDVFLNQSMYTVHADRRIGLGDFTFVYDPVDEVSTITLPYSTTGDIEVICTRDVEDEEDSVFAFRQSVTKVNGTTFTVPVDLSYYTKVEIGVPYTFMYRFSKQFMRTPDGNLMLEGRLQLRYLSLEYNKTSYFVFTVSSPGREDVSTVFNGVLVGGDGSVLGSAPFASGTKRIPLMANARDVTLTIENDGPFGNSFAAAEWQAIYTPKSRRVN